MGTDVHAQIRPPPPLQPHPTPARSVPGKQAMATEDRPKILTTPSFWPASTAQHDKPWQF